eukprot:748400-Hanusia_phi.AAC.8
MASIAWDAYEELGVSCSASLDEVREKGNIKTAFREKARKFHPDKMSSIGEAETFIKIRRAYEILSDEASRSSYDRSLMCSVNSTSNILEVDLGKSFNEDAQENIRYQFHRWKKGLTQYPVAVVHCV